MSGNLLRYYAVAPDISEGGFLKARLSFPSEFPLLPPKMRFITPMWHPNGTSSNSEGPRSHWLIVVRHLQFIPMAAFVSPFWYVQLRFGFPWIWPDGA